MVIVLFLHFSYGFSDNQLKIFYFFWRIGTKEAQLLLEDWELLSHEELREVPAVVVDALCERGEEQISKAKLLIVDLSGEIWYFLHEGDDMGGQFGQELFNFLLPVEFLDDQGEDAVGVSLAEEAVKLEFLAKLVSDLDGLLQAGEVHCVSAGCGDEDGLLRLYHSRCLLLLALGELGQVGKASVA